MIEKPILFNSEMVIAVLDGSKNQTRRVIKVQPPDDRYQLGTMIESTAREDRKNEGKHHWLIYENGEITSGDREYFSCPYGKVGSELWVRETWKYNGFTDEGIPFIKYAADGEVEYKLPSDEWSERVQDIWAELSDDIEDEVMDHKWRPSIFMPRWASRIQLRITNIRVERVCDISEEDCKGEGVYIELRNAFLLKPPRLRYKFEKLWDSINLDRGFGWETNPYVWVVDFEVLK